MPVTVHPHLLFGNLQEKCKCRMRSGSRHQLTFIMVHVAEDTCAFIIITSTPVILQVIKKILYIEIKKM